MALILDGKIASASFAGKLAEKREKAVNPNSLIMALSGYRSGPAAQELLKELGGMLETWPTGNPL